ncbi:MoxR family ATPase [Holdemania sp. Marseille-P2844]|uniref:AAA family ATPase n=1 Tax=Holdemania sp. Marseille-P2844 TaxID=1852366 RepID=UPI000A8CB81A|nr:MoxR family ATPase [Holdemania sp. Marseille-P2844]
MQNYLTSVRIHDDVLHYLIRLCERTRELPAIELGVSPRGVLALTQMTKAHAVLMDRNYALPQDVRAVFNDVCAHRLILRPQARVEGIMPKALMNAVLDEIAPPQKPGGARA